MCHKSCIEFGKAHLKEEYVLGKSIIEVGSYDVNGSLRPIAIALEPSLYIGVDIQMGPGVDQICKAENLINKFGINQFDLLICTELLEHCLNWKKVIHNLKEIIKPDGILLITTRSNGFGYHGYPFDFWRYEIADMELIFKDFKIEILEKDPQVPGVFLLARKPSIFKKIGPDNHKLFSIILNKKATIIWNTIYWYFIKLPKKKLSKCMYYILNPQEAFATIRRKLNRSIK